MAKESYNSDLTLEAISFWKQTLETDFSNHPKTLEGEFFTQTTKSPSEAEHCVLSLHKRFLLCSRKDQLPEVDYVDLMEDMYYVEIISFDDPLYSPKYPHAFRISANEKSFNFYCQQKHQLMKWMLNFRKYCLMKDFYDNYSIVDLIGVGGYGEVYLLEQKFTGIKRAGKVVKNLSLIEHGPDAESAITLNEIRILRQLDHMNIIKIYELYEMDNKIWIVMEYIEGGSLFNCVTQGHKLSERDCAIIMKQLLIILVQLEEKKIIHRDIKLENLMLTEDKFGNLIVKLIDFGLAVSRHSSVKVKKCGTAGYIAPEILNNEPYDYRSDLYSTGVVMYTCLTGKPLFAGYDYHELLRKNKLNLIVFNDAYKKISNEAQDLIERLLKRRPSDRISLEGAINHEWFQENLTAEEIKDFIEQSFGMVKMTVPDEKEIASIPLSLGQIPKSVSTLDCLNNRSFNEPVGFYFNSRQDYPSLNSFYKISNTKKEGRTSLANFEASSPKKMQKFVSFKPKAASHNMIPANRKNSNAVLQKDKDKSPDLPYHQGTSEIVSLDLDLDSLEDEGITCGDRYKALEKKQLCFESLEKLRGLH